jgi:hypothetical protein
METTSNLNWQVKKIAEDHDRGAAAIGADLQKHLVPWNGDREEAQRLAQLIVAAKPVMSPILHIANHLLGAPRPPTPPAGLGLTGLTLVTADKRKQRTRDPAVEDGIRRILKATDRRPLRVLTYSASGTVEAVLDGLQQETGELERVYLSEAQPGCEGRSLAAQLAAEWGPHGTEVVLTHDAALPALLPDADVLVLGADLVLPEGIVNKVGTATLIERARAIGIPVIVVAAQDKAPPKGIKAHHLPLPLATEAGQLQDPPTGVRTVGLAFEWVDTAPEALPAWAKHPEVPAAQTQLIQMLQAVKDRQTQTQSPAAARGGTNS